MADMPLDYCEGEDMASMTPDDHFAAAGDHYARASENSKMAAQTIDKGKKAHYATMAHGHSHAGDVHSKHAAMKYAVKNG